jgi:tetratricopeptide (TPR) repeat protein
LKKYLLLIDGLILVSLFSAEAQNLSQTMDFASRQYQRGNTDEAISLYQRVLFFDSLNIHSFEACRNLASCYISVDNNSKAREFSRMAGNLAPTDSLKNEQIFQLAYLYLAEDDYNYALIELLGLEESGSGYFQMKRNFYLGVAYFQQTDYQKSIGFFLKCIDSTNRGSREELINILDEVRHIEKRYNPKTAKILSMILPGLGQLYCGEYLGAVNSLVLTAGLAVLYIITIDKYSFADATISVLPWFQRYYQGGFQNAEKAAIKRRQNRIKKQYQQILTVIQP